MRRSRMPANAEADHAVRASCEDVLDVVQAPRDHAYDLILPAIEPSSDGTSVFIGGHVEIWVMDDAIRIDDPTVLAPGHV